MTSIDEKKVDYNIEYAHIYGHDIIDQKLASEHIKSIEICKSVINRLEDENKSYVLNVLLDDYNEPCDIDLSSIYKLLGKNNLEPNYIIKESIFTERSEALLNLIPNKFVSKSNKGIDFISETDDMYLRTIPETDFKSIKEVVLDEYINKTGFSETKKNSNVVSAQRFGARSKFEVVLTTKLNKKTLYSCPIMTASWHLSRLGTEGFKLSQNEIYTLDKNTKPFYGDRLITILPRKYMKVEATALELLSLVNEKRITKKKRKMQYIYF